MARSHRPPKLLPFDRALGPVTLLTAAGEGVGALQNSDEQQLVHCGGQV